MTLLNDPSPHRVSACPVHFLWDGRGFGRRYVRGGFFGLVLAGVLYFGNRAFGLGLGHVFVDFAWMSLAVWAVGQGLSQIAARRHRTT